MAGKNAQPEQPQLYIITPAEFELDVFPDLLARVLDAQPIACVRMAMASQDELRLSKAADALREVTHARDVALVISDHIPMVERLGLDGVHLSDGAHQVRYARKELGTDAIVGVHSSTSRHDGMGAGEAGADYVCFGPVRENTLGDGSFAEIELFKWWSEVIEVPVVAEGLLNIEMIKTLAPMTDFFAFGDEIWASDDPVAALAMLTAAMS
jgi:thiamine-phosphate pyrophosphorylase